MWGIVGNGNLVLVRLHHGKYQGQCYHIQYLYGICGYYCHCCIGSVLILYISKKVTDPIKKLYLISDEMKKLNFEAKYENQQNYKNEIDVLGQNMNELSETLETTIKELKNANIALKAGYC